MKKAILTLSLLVYLTLVSFSRNVMTWIPVYGTGNCKALLNDPDKSVWLKNGLTHIGLQFWVPGDNGKVVFVTDYKFTYKASTISQDVTDFAKWGNDNNVKVMLCLFNMREGDFDWTYTKKVIHDYPNETVASIMTIINNYNLDGVDIDFEGIGDFISDKPAYVHFLDTLGKALHASGKELSADIFSTPCYNSPNPSWESAMAPHVDFMNIMGYSDTHENDNTLFPYCPQTPSENNSYPFRYSYIENYLTVKQGVASSKLNYGLPGWAAEWGGQCAHENITDILDISSAGGIAIWDLQLNGGGFWKEAVTWDLIAQFKNNKTSSEIRSNLLICGIATPTKDKAELSPIFYDSYNEVINLSGLEGDLILYSSTGIFIDSWNVKAGESVQLNKLSTGLYIIKFNCKRGVYSDKLVVSSK
jgi:hypothetical protein